MRDGTLFFDTAACMIGPWWGSANAMLFTPTTARYERTEARLTDTQTSVSYTQQPGWWLTDGKSPYQKTYDQYGNELTDATASPIYEEGRYDTDLQVQNWYAGVGMVDKAGSNLKYYDSTEEDTFEVFFDMIDNCDIDCQQKGSQMTLIATLMGTMYGIIGLNALFMFIGAWRYRWRACSLYCTFFVFFF